MWLISKCCYSVISVMHLFFHYVTIIIIVIAII